MAKLNAYQQRYLDWLNQYTNIPDDEKQILINEISNLQSTKEFIKFQDKVKSQYGAITLNKVDIEPNKMNINTSAGNITQPSYLDKDVTSKEYLDSLAETAYKNYAGLMVDPNGPQAQQYRTDMLNAINAEEAQYNATLNNLELDAYRQIGYQQQELENQIAENRLKAIKSGTTSAQLAAQQLNNMFAAQSGAAQIAQQAMNDRLSAAQQYSQMRNTGLTTGLYDTINNNRQALATAGAQNYAVMGSYGSYINSQLANIQANKALYDINPKQYAEILNPVK